MLIRDIEGKKMRKFSRGRGGRGRGEGGSEADLVRVNGVLEMSEAGNIRGKIIVRDTEANAQDLASRSR